MPKSLQPHGLAALQALLSMGFSRQKYWSGLPFPSCRDLPNPGIEPASFMSPALQMDSSPLAPPGKPTIRLKWSEVAQSCPTLCDPVDCSPPGSSIHGILQARILSGLPFPSPGDLLNPGIKPRSPALQADALTSEPPGISKSYFTDAETVRESLNALSEQSSP